MLTPPDLPDGADLRPPRDIEWGMSMKGEALERVQNVVLVGLFDKEAAAAECLRIIGAEDEPGRERKAPALSYLGSFRVDTSGQVVPGSFSANSYALHFERLPEFTRDTTARSEEIAADFEAKYREFMIPARLAGGDPDTPAPMARRRMDLASINAAASWLAAQLSKSPPSVAGSGLLQKEVMSEEALVHSVDGGRDDPSPGPLCDDALATDGFRASCQQHSVQDGHADGSLGLLGSEAAGSQPWSNQRFVAAHCCFY